MQPSKPHNRICLVVGFLSLLSCALSHATDFRVGAAAGLGGVGAQTKVPTDNSGSLASVSSGKTVSRNEGPGTFGFFVDYLVNDYFSVSLEHSRGFRLGPFSSGASLTGFAGRYYFYSSDPAPMVPKAAGEKTTLLMKKFSPFAGLGIGVAIASIERSRDLVPKIDASGVYVGLRLGADYPLARGVGLRPEIQVSSTPMTSETDPSTISQFSLQCGVYLIL